MANRLFSRVVAMRCAYILLGFGMIFLLLLPLETTARRWAGPDLLVSLTVAWTLRRPEYVPVVAIAVLFLFADLLLLRPPGIMAAIVVVTCEILRRRALSMRDATFVTEWLTATVAIFAIALVTRLILTITFVAQVSLGLTLIQVIMSVLAYPLVVIFSRLTLGLRKPLPGDVNTISGSI